MNITLMTLNSSFTHTALALHSLKQSIAIKTNFKPKIIELTVNQNYDYILAEIFKSKPDVICFSCYIWNIKFIENIIVDVKKILPNVVVICGGPEVSYNSKKFMENNPDTDYVISGEAEQALPDLLNAITKEPNKSIPKTVTYKKDNEIIKNKTVGVIKNPDSLYFPYEIDFIKNNKNKIFYYESSRGCPYSCSYCISSIDKTYRKKSLDKVFREIRIFTDSKVKLLKFTDRTFNADKKRAAAILEFIASLDTKTLFHFEIAADILERKIINILKKMPVGRVQLEAGIQSTNKKTIKAINRNIAFEHSSRNIKEIMENNNIHVHTDLIAGLPYEGIESFKKSFDDVYMVGGHHLQLGFLKVLKGTVIEEQYNEKKCGFTSLPPYEILNTPWLDYSDILTLKSTEYALNKFYNSSNFKYSMEYIIESGLMKPFSLYSKLGEYIKKAGYPPLSLSAYKGYDLFLQFTNQNDILKEKKEIITAFVKIDMVSSFKLRKLPKKYKKLINYSVIKKNKRQKKIKSYRFDDLSVKVLNENEEAKEASSLNIVNYKNAIEVDYTRKNKVTDIYPFKLVYEKS